MNINGNKSGDQVREGVTREHGSQVGNAATQKSSAISLAPEDQVPIEQGLTDADAFSALASQREQSEDPGQTDGPDVDPKINDWEDDEMEPRVCQLVTQNQALEHAACLSWIRRILAYDEANAGRQAAVVLAYGISTRCDARFEHRTRLARLSSAPAENQRLNFQRGACQASICSAISNASYSLIISLPKVRPYAGKILSTPFL